jgi:hypothetical protein
VAPIVTRRRAVFIGGLAPATIRLASTAKPAAMHVSTTRSNTRRAAAKAFVASSRECLVISAVPCPQCQAHKTIDIPGSPGPGGRARARSGSRKRSPRSTFGSSASKVCQSWNNGARAQHTPSRDRAPRFREPHHIIKAERIAQLSLFALEPRHHRPTPQIASERRNHCSQPSNGFLQQNRP